MLMIYVLCGVLKFVGVMLKLECVVVVGIVQVVLFQSVVVWEYLVEDYDCICNDIEVVLLEFVDYNQCICYFGGFYLINVVVERCWMMLLGKVNFIISKGLLEDFFLVFNSKLVMVIVCSYDQYNMMIYGMDDCY